MATFIYHFECISTLFPLLLRKEIFSDFYIELTDIISLQTGFGEEEGIFFLAGFFTDSDVKDMFFLPAELVKEARNA